MISYPYEVIRSRRRTAAVEIYPGGRIVLRVPNRFSRRQIDALLFCRKAWIERKYHELAPLSPGRDGIQLDFPRREGEELQLLGDRYRMSVVVGGRRNTVEPVWEEKRFVVRVRSRSGAENAAGRVDEPKVDAEGTVECSIERAVERTVERWYRNAVREIFERRIVEMIGSSKVDPPLPGSWPPLPDISTLRLGEFNFSPASPPSVSVRSMKRRWGSCSSSRNVTFNIFLAAHPASEIDYVIVHELCHFREMNHSRRFYALMEAILPDWRERRNALNGRQA